MNLFRSEEHARNWSQFRSYYVESLKPLAFYLERFGNEMMRSRARPDFISWYADWRLQQAQRR